MPSAERRRKQREAKARAAAAFQAVPVFACGAAADEAWHRRMKRRRKTAIGDGMQHRRGNPRGPDTNRPELVEEMWMRGVMAQISWPESDEEEKEGQWHWNKAEGQDENISHGKQLYLQNWKQEIANLIQFAQEEFRELAQQEDLEAYLNYLSKEQDNMNELSFDEMD